MIAIENVKVKSLIRRADMSVKVDRDPKNCSLLVVDVSFQASTDRENDSGMSGTGIEVLNLIAHFVPEGGSTFEATALANQTNVADQYYQITRPKKPSQSHAEAQRKPSSTPLLFPHLLASNSISVATTKPVETIALALSSRFFRPSKALFTNSLPRHPRHPRHPRLC
jgi:hypothetical protein